jgi:hypothetical protein
MEMPLKRNKITRQSTEEVDGRSSQLVMDARANADKKYSSERKTERINAGELPSEWYHARPRMPGMNECRLCAPIADATINENCV